LVSRTLHRIGWIGLTLVSVFMLVAVASDLTSDNSDGIPTDHAGTFTKLAGQSFTRLTASAAGIGHYVTRLEVGSALHELTFAVLFWPSWCYRCGGDRSGRGGRARQS
jgi:hypothetical protein